jgi:hypothetical protein
MPLWLPSTVGGPGQTNLTAASRQGTSITSSGSLNTKGTYVSLIDPLTEDAYGVHVRIRGVHVAAAVHNVLVDLAYGPTGGGSEQIIWPDIGGGAASNDVNTDGKHFYLPYYIPAGTRISARCQANTASKVVAVAVYLVQEPQYAPDVAGEVTAYGVDAANSRGTSCAVGSGAFGAWTQIAASTSRAHRYWACVQDMLADTTETGTGQNLIEVGFGPDSSNVTTIFRGTYNVSNNEAVGAPFPMLSYAPVPASSIIFARIASGATEARGVIVYGMD